MIVPFKETSNGAFAPYGTNDVHRKPSSLKQDPIYGTNGSMPLGLQMCVAISVFAVGAMCAVGIHMIVLGCNALFISTPTVLLPPPPPPPETAMDMLTRWARGLLGH